MKLKHENEKAMGNEKIIKNKNSKQQKVKRSKRQIKFKHPISHHMIKLLFLFLLIVYVPFQIW